MAPAVIHCVMCNLDKIRGRWSDGIWAQDCCQDCVDMMHDRILKFKTKQLMQRGELGF